VIVANLETSDSIRTKEVRLKRFRLGPGIIIAASFIGPGTVTTATVTGASYGYALIWAVVFSIFATIVLQDMASRLGIVIQDGLGDAFRSSFQNPMARFFVIALVICAIGIGGGSYAGGDTTGTAFALSELTHLPK
jgi:NRAMP (natural resistance-associated macrophage protein)-like metal ion transporter